MSSASSARWAVIGGGFMGLTLAARLADAGVDVSLIEAAPAIGGLAKPHRFGGITWDRFYHVILATDRSLRGLLARVELDSELQFRRTGTGLHIGGRLHAVSTPWELLRCPALPVAAKFGLARAVLASMLPATVEALDKESATAWLTRHSGPAAVRTVWRPLLRAKLGDAADEASALFVWTTLRRLYGVGAGRTGSGLFGFVPGGYDRILSAMRGHLAASGVSLAVDWPVARIGRANGRLLVQHRSGEERAFDRVVVTLPDTQIAAMVPELSDAERRRLGSAPYLGVVCLSLLVDEPVTPFYVSNVTDPASPFTGIIEMTNLTGTGPFGGRSLVYLPLYVPATDPRFAAPDARLTREFLAYLEASVPTFSGRRVVATAVSRASHVLRVPSVDRLSSVPSIETSVPGLHIVNSSQIVDGTLNVNEVVRHAERAAATLLGVHD